MKTIQVIAAALLAAACATPQSPSPYSGQEKRGVKALSAEERAGLLEGAGMGYAKAAELNRYPGPAHVLDLGKALALSPSQHAAIEEILGKHKAETRALGAQIVELEEALDARFAARQASAASIDDAVSKIAALHGKLRASHLKAHVATAALLTPAQIERYVEMRGYASGGQHRH